MKHFLIIILFLTGSFALFSQSALENRCPYKNVQLPDSRIVKEANDFTITTTDGITRNLYNTLDSGKTVFVDLFFTTCSWCQYYAPIIEEIYVNHGAGTGDIEFWGISNNLFDPDSVIDAYKLAHNITNPCAGPNGGGTTAHTIVIAGQNFLGWPSYVVICPDRTMYFDPVYPPTVTGFDPYFESCAETIGVEEGIGNSEKCIVSVYPNPSPGSLYMDINFTAFGQANIEIFNLLGIKVFDQVLDITPGIHSYKIIADNLPSGTYFLKLTRDNQLLGSHKVMIYRD
jgi:hypothetical protein